MGTTIRANISKKNPYYITPHRYYELKYFCLQYPEWLKSISDIETSLLMSTSVYKISSDSNEWVDPTGNAATSLAYLKRNIKMVKDAVEKTDSGISWFLLKAVTEGVSYTYLRTVLEMPCGKGYFYKAYRKFWWVLSTERYTGYGF